MSPDNWGSSRRGPEGTGEEAVRLERAGKRYPGKVALQPLDLRISRGQRVAVVGPSGAGKTTLLHLVAGVERPDPGGRVLLEGRDLSRLRPGPELAALVGVIHQQFDLVPHLSVLHNVLAGRLGRWGLLPSILSLLVPRERPLALRALERVGMLEDPGRRAAHLSGGEQQRVAIARLLVQDPAVIVADEPVASLDPARARDVVDLLTEVADEGGKTLVASLHTVELVRGRFHRVIGLREGRVAFDCGAAELSEAELRALYRLDADGTGDR